MGTDKKLLLEVSDLKVHFSIKSDKAWPWAKPSALKAVDGVTLRLYEGRPSVWWGVGLWQIHLCPGADRPGAGHRRQVVWLGNDLTKLDQKALREAQRIR